MTGESPIVYWNGEPLNTVITDTRDGKRLLKVVQEYKTCTTTELQDRVVTCDVMSDRKSRRSSKRGRWETQQAYTKRMRKAGR